MFIRKLLQMLSVVGMLVCLEQIDAFGSEMKDELVDNSGRAPAIVKAPTAAPGPDLLRINHLYEDLIRLFFKEVSKDVNPRLLTSICKQWYSVMREQDSISEEGELHYTKMNPFMKRCMETYWESRFYNGTLHYTPQAGGNAVSLKFSGPLDGTFDLSACGNAGRYLVITTSMDRFFTVGAENKDKTVILIVLRHLVEQGIKSANHSYSPLMAIWDADKAPVGIFWRVGNDKNLTWASCLTTQPMSKISSWNLFEIWQKSFPVWLESGPWGLRDSRLFYDFMSIF